MSLVFVAIICAAFTLNFGKARFLLDKSHLKAYKVVMYVHLNLLTLFTKSDFIFL